MFTINFGEPEGGGAPPYEQLDPVAERWAERGVKYCRWQVEVGGEGVEHIQGYMELSQGQTMVWVHKNLPGMERSSLQERAGSAAQADAYCSKSESRVDGPWSFGVKSDLVECWRS